MNFQKLTNIIALYKRYFHEIHREEIYKWRAVKWFGDNWDIETADFPAMLDRSLHGAKNLLASGVYYPKRMIVNNAIEEPEVIRELFRALFDERQGWESRMIAFKAGVKSVNDSYFNGTNHYQDERAILVYLCLRFPEKYFFYKYEMFRQFVALVDHDIVVKRGYASNTRNYYELCLQIRSFVENDPELLALHNGRLSDLEYHDIGYHILTQDIIYAATAHIDRFAQNGSQPNAAERLRKRDIAVSPLDIEPVLEGVVMDYGENENERKWMGDLGEQLVLEYEKQLTKAYGLNKEVIHASKVWGDGLGYDILSFRKNGEAKYIEVKTTRGQAATPFYITGNELALSAQYPDNFCLYRLYAYDTDNHTADFYVWEGSLKQLCSNPVLYKAVTKIE